MIKTVGVMERKGMRQGCQKGCNSMIGSRDGVIKDRKGLKDVG